MSDHILVLANNSDGLYGFRKELLSELAQRGSLTAAVPNNGWFRELEQLGCRIIETPVDRRGINPITDLSLFFRYIQLLRRENPSLVITYTIKPNVYGGFACRLLGIPYAINVTGLGTAFQKDGILRQLVVFLYKLALKKAKVVFFENAGNMATLLDEVIVRQEQCMVLNGAGVNLERYAYTPYPKDKEPIHFLFIGRVMAEKGVNELFDAMERLHQEGINCTLDVLGYFEDHYEARIHAAQEAGWLRYHGFQKNVKPYIAASHCFVLPSWHEGMANTNLECAAMGRPLITSRIHGCMEAVIEGESGLLCEAKNADSFYAAMKTFCTLSPAQREQMGQAGRQHMEAVFDKKKVILKTLEGLGL